MTTNTDTDFFAPIIERIVAKVDSLSPVNHLAYSARDFVEALKEPRHPSWTRGMWDIALQVHNIICNDWVDVPEPDDIDDLLEAMDDLAENAND